MFNEISIVSTAASSFNNSALVAPFFLLVGILTLPLFFMVYLYGHDFVSKIGWTKDNVKSQIVFWLTGSLILWLLLFGGNYSVIRDGISWLPIALAVVLFGLTTLFICSAKELKYIEKIRHYKYRWLVFLLVLFMAGFSAVPTWYNILLNVSAVLCAIIFGSRLKSNISLVPYSVLVCGILLVAIWLQPEYFRFGQLGNLTILHLVSVIITGFFAVTCLVAKYTNTLLGNIHQSAYIKLRWLFRIMSIFTLVLFFMTESVPVFIGLLAVCGISETLYICHNSSINKDLSKHAFSWFLICLGIILICPVVTAIGVVYLTFIPTTVKAKDFIGLL